MSTPTTTVEVVSPIGPPPSPRGHGAPRLVADVTDAGTPSHGEAVRPGAPGPGPESTRRIPPIVRVNPPFGQINDFRVSCRPSVAVDVHDTPIGGLARRR